MKLQIVDGTELYPKGEKRLFDIDKKPS